MPEPLTIKRPKVASVPMQFLVASLLIVPMLALWYAGSNHLDIHFETPWLNFTVHAALLAIPLIWVFWISAPRMEFQETEEELLGTSTFFEKLPIDWWTMFLTWPAPILTIGILGHSCFTKYLAHPEDLSTTPPRALAIMSITFGLGLFYASLLLGKPRILVSPGGLRAGLIRFFEWEKIDHLSKSGDIYSLYHRANPALPAVSFKISNLHGQRTLERYAVENCISFSNIEHPAFSKIKIGVLCGFVLNLVFCFWLYFSSTLSPLSIILISFCLGIILTLLLEKMRAISKFGRHMPNVQPESES